MKDEIDIKQRIKTILYCLIVMCILGTILIFIDPKINQHMYLLIAPFVVAIGSAIGVVIIYLKTRKNHSIMSGGRK